LLQNHGLQSDGSQSQEHILVDGLLQNGTDRSALWRAHVREMTMARQAAERRPAGPGPAIGLDKPAQLTLARARAVALRLELTRINAEHRIWMRSHGVDLAERPTRRRAAPRTTQQ
jgi:hypothetical protein